MWARLINTSLGIWLMAAPAVLGYGDPVAVSDRVVGPVIAAVGIMAISDVLRPLRWISTVVGVWVVLAPWALGAATTDTAVNGALVGLIVAGLSTVRGEVRHRIGGGWRAVWRPGVAESRAGMGGPA
jgi:hypothetical protein